RCTDAGPASAEGLDEALAREGLVGEHHRVARDAELGTQLSRGRKRVASPQHPVFDQRGDLPRDLVLQVIGAARPDRNRQLHGVRTSMTTIPERVLAWGFGPTKLAAPGTIRAAAPRLYLGAPESGSAQAGRPGQTGDGYGDLSEHAARSLFQRRW